MYTDDYRPSVPPPKRFATSQKASDEGKAEHEMKNAAAKVKPAPEMVQRPVTRDGDFDWRPFVPKPDVRVNAKVEPLPEPASAASGDANDGNLHTAESRPMRISIGILSFIGWVAFFVVALWMFAVSAPFFRDALTLQGWRSWAAFAIGLLPILGVLGLVVYALVRFLRLPKIAQIKRTPDITDAKLRELIKSRYLSRIPDAKRYAQENGFNRTGNEKRGEEVSNCIRRLRGEVDGHYSDSTGWLMEFNRLMSFQDERAEEIISRTWKQVGLLTAASPWKIGDRLVTAYHSSIMIVQLSRLYNRQVSGPAAFRLACRWLIDIYVAGELGELAANTMPSLLSSFPLLGSILGKTAEGGVNAVLVVSLGHRAMKFFKPLQ